MESNNKGNNKSIDTQLKVTREIRRGGGTIEDTINSLPKEYQSYFENYEITEESTQYLQEAVLRDKAQIASNGSHVPDTYRGAGGAIMMSEDREEHNIKIGCKCKYEEDMTSTSAEHYGVIGGLLLALMVTMKEETETYKQKRIFFWIYNAEVLDLAKR